ncbi:unnamed protein product [Ectocarpus sp. CCAP 1310/34]|nr:unnamed protein product [Ectocarpus sp. CCAP 1310/34]
MRHKRAFAPCAHSHLAPIKESLTRELVDKNIYLHYFSFQSSLGPNDLTAV